MALYCDPSCAPAGIAAAIIAGCTPVFRNKGLKRIVLINCDTDIATILPPTAADDIIDNLAALYADGVASTAFVTPSGITTDISEEDPTEVIYDDCGGVAYVNGAFTVTMQFKYGWDITPAAVSPAVDQYGEDTFWQAIKSHFNGYNYGFVNCDGELGYFMNEDQTTFASGTISVRDLTPEDINGCLKLSAKEVKLTFKCGANMKRIATLADPDFDALAAWV